MPAGVTGVVLSTLSIRSSVEGSTVARGRVRLIGVATGYGAAALAMPICAIDDVSWWSVVRALIATAVAAGIAVLASGRRARGWVLASIPVAVAAALLFDVTSPGVITIVVAVLPGAAVGLAAPRPWRPPDAVGIGAAAGVATVLIVRAAAGSGWSLAVGAAAVVVSALTTLSVAPARARRRRGWIVPVAALVASAALLGWTGANDPRVGWFGRTIWHGPRDGDAVAITFDDGPNGAATLAVRDILDRYGVKATFFLVGKALDADPTTAQALLADGMLLGGHSYHHDYWRWLDPRYPELQRTIDAFKRHLDVCPHLYRPPHGQRTPFMNLLLSNRDMVSVTWDVSAGDWATDDAALVAERVLRDVRPGSIILLHDGLDGNVGADRSVLVRALPLVLDGLRERGLRPVRVDELVGEAAYADSC
jgi:peptidoglycan/xylan/chitin deacetylase (PgdA/CDA1 family)